jgi:hypothetical protein
VSAAELRAQAGAFRDESARAASEKADLARAMARAGSENEHRALELQAGVADCRSRRFAQWAARLEEAAYELENP